VKTSRPSERCVALLHWRAGESVRTCCDRFERTVYRSCSPSRNAVPSPQTEMPTRGRRCPSPTRNGAMRELRMRTAVANGY
jgi:hypothetical protein